MPIAFGYKIYLILNIFWNDVSFCTFAILIVHRLYHRSCINLLHLQHWIQSIVSSRHLTQSCQSPSNSKLSKVFRTKFLGTTIFCLSGNFTFFSNFLFSFSITLLFFSLIFSVFCGEVISSAAFSLSFSARSTPGTGDISFSISKELLIYSRF